MTHEQAIERLDDYASGELPDIERRLMERHLESCGECRAEVEAIRALLRMSRRSRRPSRRRPTSGGIAGRWSPHVRGRAGGGRREGHPLRSAPEGLAASALGAAAAAAVVLMSARRW